MLPCRAPGVQGQRAFPSAGEDGQHYAALCFWHFLLLCDKAGLAASEL